MRARNIKPGFFKNDLLGECTPLARVIFIGLWCMADKEGIIQYRPKKIKVEIIPYDSVGVEKYLEELHEKGFLVFVVANDDQRMFLEVVNFLEHQSPHPKEKDSGFKDLIESQVISGNFTKLQSPLLIPDVMNPDVMNPDYARNGTYSETEQELLIIPLKDKGKHHSIYQKDIDDYKELFPMLDIMPLLRFIKQWNVDNDKKRKTSGGIKTHITNWLKREHDKGRRGGYYNEDGQGIKQQPLPEGKKCKDCENIKDCVRKKTAMANQTVCLDKENRFKEKK